MKVHNKPPYDTYKTLLQWAQLGKVATESAEGVELWHNAYKQGRGVYYAPDAVRDGSKAELDIMLGPLRQKKRQQAAARRAKRLEEIKATAANDAIHDLFVKSLTRLDRSAQPMGKPIVIDTETTGLADDDELLQVSIIDIDGSVLYNSYIRPYQHESWPSAQRINNISPQTVADAPYLHEVAFDIGRIVVDAPLIIGYNLDFDLGFLSCCGAIRPNDHAAYYDVMCVFAAAYTEDGRWRKLLECADYFEYDWHSHGGPHDSLEDARATLHCYKRMCADLAQTE